MPRDETKKRREKVEHIRQDYPSFEASMAIPENVQMFVFYMPFKHLDAPDLCGIIFPKKDYGVVSKIMNIKPLNKVEQPQQYVGVNWEFYHPFAVLELGLEHLAESPIKILYDNGQYVFTKDKMLKKDSFFNPSHPAVVLDAADELVDASKGLVDAVSGLKKEAKKLVDSIK